MDYMSSQFYTTITSSHTNWAPFSVSYELSKYSTAHTHLELIILLNTTVTDHLYSAP